MQQRLFSRVSRLLLVVMLTTFLSPSFAVGMLSSHEQLEHSTLRLVAVETVDIVYDRLSHPQQEHTEHLAHEHENAHGFIGHLLGHMPAVMSGTLPVSIPPVVQSNLAVPSNYRSFTLLDLPFRPPRSISCLA